MRGQGRNVVAAVQQAARGHQARAPGRALRSHRGKEAEEAFDAFGLHALGAKGAKAEARIPES